MNAPSYEGPSWPLRLTELCDELRAPVSDAARDVARGEVWVLLNAALMRYLRIHAGRVRPISREDLEDLASQKAIDLLRRAELGQWTVTGRRPAEVAGFISTVARNGLIDRLRMLGRWESSMDAGDETHVAEARHALVAVARPDDLVAGKEFALAAKECAEKLDDRSRRVWFFRVFYDMPSKEIATHPEVRLKPGHVDLLLQRSRQSMTECLRRKGHQRAAIPPGTFAELWKAFDPSAALQVAVSHES